MKHTWSQESHLDFLNKKQNKTNLNRIQNIPFKQRGNFNQTNNSNHQKNLKFKKLNVPVHYEACHCRTNTQGSLQQGHASPREIWVWLAGETMRSRACCGCCGWWNGRLVEALWGVHWWRAANPGDSPGRRSVFLSGCFRGVSRGGMRSWTQLEGIG